MNHNLYPLKFKPILQDKVWGGNKLASIYGKGNSEIAGESWELSGVKGYISEVSNGSFEGRDLVSLIEEFKGNLVGDQVYEQFGTQFPLLFKFIDAREDLSVQLHPDDSVALARHNSFGKTEMWYILQAEEDARLILGFNTEMNAKDYAERLSDGKITEILHDEKVQPGEAYFLAPGTVHAIGAGVMLAEIQQTSNITYRIYDWDRPGTDGKMRDLHTELALDVINFNSRNPKLNFEETWNDEVKICESKYFRTNKWNLTKSLTREFDSSNSFRVYMCLEGEATIKCLGTSERITKGDTILIPAMAKDLHIDTSKASLLEVYVP